MSVRSGLKRLAHSSGRGARMLVAFLVLSTLGPVAASPAGASREILRGVYGRDSSASRTDIIRATGFNAVTNAPERAQLDALHAKGLKALIWLGDYHRTARCQFERGDDWIRLKVNEIKGHPAIAAYQVSDEPNYARVAGCNAAADTRRRAALVKSIDPSKPTYVTISAWDGREGFPYQYFAGTTDIMGLVVYPCSRTNGCKMSDIDAAIAHANSDGISRYWAVVQDFDDSWYRLPSATELKHQFDRWARSRMEGFFLYHWNHGEIEQRRDHLDVLRASNARFAGGMLPITPAPSPSVSPPPPAPSRQGSVAVPPASSPKTCTSA